MKTRHCILLSLLVLMVACAPGYYAPKSAYQEAPPSPAFTVMSFDNPETDQERENRIWSEESGR